MHTKKYKKLSCTKCVAILHPNEQSNMYKVTKNIVLNINLLKWNINITMTPISRTIIIMNTPWSKAEVKN